MVYSLQGYLREILAVLVTAKLIYQGQCAQHSCNIRWAACYIVSVKFWGWHSNYAHGYEV